MHVRANVVHILFQLIRNIDFSSRRNKTVKEQIMLAKKTKAMLNLERLPVGVKLVYSKEDYDRYEGKELVAPMNYCVAVRSAGYGHSIKISKETSRCMGSTTALGFQLPPETFYNGTEGCEMGIFVDPKIAAETTNQFKILKKPLYGIIVKPLEKFIESEPDVVLVVTNPRESMRLLQSYTCTYGMQTNLCASGNQAMCVECTAFPIMTGKLNISLMCSGTRHHANWKETEMAIGIPYSKFKGTVEGIRNTINGTEPDERKTEIIENLKEMDINTDDIVLGTAYYYTD